MTQKDRLESIKHKYKGLQGDMPPFGDVLFLLREVERLSNITDEEPSDADVDRVARATHFFESTLDWFELEPEQMDYKRRRARASIIAYLGAKCP